MQQAVLTALVLGLSLVANAAAQTNSAPLLKHRDVIAFVGGEDVVQMQFNGYLESSLLAAAPSLELRFRNLGWEGDTVFEQPRQLNWGAWSNHLSKAGATVVVAQFGQSESLGGPAGLTNFTAAYGRLLDQFSLPGLRFILLTPARFEENPIWNAARRNANLQAYAKATEALALRRGCGFIDLFSASLRATALPLERRGEKLAFTRDGMHLTAQGHWEMAMEFARQLGLKPGVVSITPAGEFTEPAWEKLRRAVLAKNELWFHHWRPMNWAFLNGDRIEQPSSHDHLNPKVRWFPKEIQEFIPLLERNEAEIFELAKALQ